MDVCTPGVMLRDCTCRGRKEGGRGLISIEGCVVKESKSLHGYLGETTEWMLQAALNEKVLDEEENLQDYKKRRQEEKIRD